MNKYPMIGILIVCSLFTMPAALSTQLSRSRRRRSWMVLVATEHYIRCVVGLAHSSIYTTYINTDQLPLRANA